ncbi:anti-sigma factor [Streptomyces sp. NPDC002499]
MASSSDHAQSEEVAQEVLVEVRRTAPRYRPDRRTAMNWILTRAARHAPRRPPNCPPPRPEQGTAQISAVLAAPDARTQAMTLPEGATGTAVISRSRTQAVLMVSGMARAPVGKTYQLWYDEDGPMRLAGLTNAARANQTILQRGAVDAASGMGMGITVEPSDGSQQPTSAPLALTRFPT